MKRNSFSLLLLFVLIFTACKKEDDNLNNNNNNTNTATGREELIAGTATKSWKKTKQLLNGSDVTAQLQACALDNLYTFERSGNKHTQTEGASKCDPSDPSTVSSGNWSLISSQTGFVWTYDNTVYEDTFSIVSINASTMVLSQVTNGVTQEYTYTAQ